MSREKTENAFCLVVRYVMNIFLFTHFTNGSILHYIVLIL